MTRQEVLRYIVLQARSKGFDFRAWYIACTGQHWASFDHSIDYLCQGRNCYALLFSHEFAHCFWKGGQQMTFLVPAVSYQRLDKDGQVVTVHRSAFARRMLKSNSWLYHLREMAESPHPLKYIRRFVVLQEDIEHARRQRNQAVAQESRGHAHHAPPTARRA